MTEEKKSPEERARIMERRFEGFLKRFFEGEPTRRERHMMWQAFRAGWRR